MSRNFVLPVLTLLSLMALAGCRQDMHDQPKYKPLRATDFFADGRSERPLVEDTVPRGFLHEDKALYEGKTKDGKAVTVFPVEVTEALIKRGQERFNIYCSPCHDHTGSGDGMVVRRGYRRPPSFQTTPYRTAPVGFYFDVITHGSGMMPDYAAQVTPEDRWAIIAYIRALQYSEYAPVADVPESEKQHLDENSGNESKK